MEDLHDKNWYFVGSLRKDSFNKLVAKTMADLFPADFEPVFINIGDLNYTIKIWMMKEPPPKLGQHSVKKLNK